MSGATPSGSPAALRLVTSRKLERLIPARRTPVGQSSARALSDMGGVYTSAGRWGSHCHPERREGSHAASTGSGVAGGDEVLRSAQDDRKQRRKTMKITDVSLTLFAWDDIPPTQYGQMSRF